MLAAPGHNNDSYATEHVIVVSSQHCPFACFWLHCVDAGGGVGLGVAGGGGGVGPGGASPEHDAMPFARPNDPSVHVQALFVPSGTVKNSIRFGEPVMGQSSTLLEKKLRTPTQTPAKATHG